LTTPGLRNWFATNAWLRWILALPSAVVGIVLAWCLLAPFNRYFGVASPLWVLPFACATAWMICAILVVPSHRLHASVVLYLIGAAIAWWLADGLIVWPYNSWPELAAALVGGGFGILVAAILGFRRSFLSALLVSAGLVVTSTTVVVGSSYIHLARTGHAWGDPGTLFTKNAEGEERKTDVRYVRDDDPSSSAIWIWTQTTNSTWYAELLQQRNASFEWDPGSGATGVLATMFDDAETRKRVEALIAESLQKRPRTLIPLPKVDLSNRVVIRLHSASCPPTTNSQ
jgi:hypothetical protein